MKTRLLAMLLAVLTLLLGGFGGACNNVEGGQHQCDYSTTLHDNEKHWNQCSCGNVTEEEEHSFVEGVCNCGYQDPDYDPTPEPEPEPEPIDFVLTQERVVSTTEYTNSAYSAFNAISEASYVIPGLNQNFVPQGMDESEEQNLMYISGYFSSTDYSTCSAVLTIDLNTGNFVGEYFLKNMDGSDHDSHAGGVAVTDKNVFVSTGGKLCRIPLSAFAQAGASGSVQIVEEIPVPVTGALCNYEDGVLWVGDFCRQGNSSYSTPSWRHLTNLANEKHYAWIVGYRLGNQTESGISADALPSGAKYATPDIILSIPQNIQGMTIAGDYIALSKSWGTSNSTIYVYNNVLDQEKHTSVTLNETEVPVWFLDSTTLSTEYVNMPRSEGLAYYDGCVYVLYESGATLYRSGKNANDRIYKMTLTK